MVIINTHIVLDVTVTPRKVLLKEGLVCTFRKCYETDKGYFLDRPSGLLPISKENFDQIASGEHFDLKFKNKVDRFIE